MTKLLVFSAFLVILPMLLVGLVSYRQSSQVLENEARNYSLQIIDLVQLYVEEYLRDIEVSTLKIINHPDTVKFLHIKSSLELEESDITSGIRNVLKNAAYSRSDVVNITIILDDIQVIDSADEADLQSVSSLKDESWYHTIPAIGEPKIISRLISRKNQEIPVLSVFKRIVNPQTLRPFGMLIIDVNYKRLQEVAYKVNPGKTGYLYILDEHGYYVYHPDISLIGKKANMHDVQAMEWQATGSISSAGQPTSLLTFSRSDPLKWKVVTSIPYEELLEGTNYIGRTILFTTIIFMVLAYIMAIGLSASLVKPIKQLYKYAKRVENGDFTGRVVVNSKDEIGKLSYGFNKMTDKLSKLLEEIHCSKLKEAEMSLKQKDTELKMLQSQINPHFLYNSLETIRGMALEKDMEEIATMAVSLAMLLRYNVKRESLQVTVRQEIKMGEIYLRIQKFRFEEKLDYRFDIPEWALEQQAVIFMLQPLLENCIVHGLEWSSGITKIVVSAEKSDETDVFILRVTDNGPGISEDRLKELLSGLEQETELTSQHIGIMNVHRRVRFLFGEAYGVIIENEPGAGATVGIRLPF
jgi:two-component system sensor histidine kinase YesM